MLESPAMLNLFATILSFVLSFFKPKAHPVGAVVAVANQEAAISAQTATQTAETTQKELANAKVQTDATVAAVAGADGVHGVADAINEVNASISRANSAGGV